MNLRDEHTSNAFPPSSTETLSLSNVWANQLCCSREVGSRLGPFLNDIIQLIVQATAVEDNDELREECLQAFESYARQCPQDFAAHVDVVRMIMSVLAH